jgi:protein ImuB
MARLLSMRRVTAQTDEARVRISGRTHPQAYDQAATDAVSIPAPVPQEPVPAHSGRKVTALRPVIRRQATAAPAAPELWVGVHLLTGMHALERLATRAQRFTPRVSLAPPDGLLLEVKGSLHLFNGVAGLCKAVAAECAALGMKCALALSPTPLSALVAARCSSPATGEPVAGLPVTGGPFNSFIVLGLAPLVSRLAPLPLKALRWPQEALDRLARMGVQTIGQVLRLPRAGFAKRFGTEPLAMLDRLTGRDAELRDRFRARERFRRKRDLTYELESHQAILEALQPLLRELGKFLQVRQCSIVQLECLLRHRQAPATSCLLRLAAPTADADRLGELLAERLNQLALPEPVRSCELRSGALVRSAFVSNTLWQPGEHGGAVSVESSGLIERLRARLGTEAVYSLQVSPRHRPESTWRAIEPDTAADTRDMRTTAHASDARPVPGSTRASDIRPPSGAARVPLAPPWPPFSRPLWLLPTPRQLSQRAGLPHCRGALRLLGDPERIETAWWNGEAVARDYYVAADIHGVRLWVFRERAAPHRWFLHGVFG